ncbi:hypothetical protein LPTSP3_g01960 [Leptospira kobayashii]|uniref:M23ase beta-sheet core domain-containing protein n=1 Tax=Leptospira kobayashii TaxID=1917830 RepID=A0ABN6K9K1_9LEPT|nr:hypothetical protein LPTSP3_g01960 [Leptospira kobayashii]
MKNPFPKQILRKLLSLKSLRQEQGLKYNPRGFFKSARTRKSQKSTLAILILTLCLLTQCQSPKGLGYQGNPLFAWLGGGTAEKKADPVSIYQRYPQFFVDSYEFPVGGKFGEGFYIAQKFGVENPKFGYRFHLGEDWNYIGGGDSDFGSPIYSIANGIVSLTADYGGGWGKIVRIVHKHPSPEKGQFFFIESLYAHLYTIEVEPGQMVRKGEWIGTIGDAGGSYPSHLHFEIRAGFGSALGGGYSFGTDGFFSPTKFLIAQVSKEKLMNEDQFAPALEKSLAP